MDKDIEKVSTGFVFNKFIEDYTNQEQDIELKSNENKTEDMVAKIIEICDYLNENCRYFKPEIALGKILIYIENYDRLLYSQVSLYYFEYGSSDNDNFISQNMQTLSDYVLSSSFENDKEIKANKDTVRKIVLKLLDHLQLADAQMKHLNKDNFYNHFWKEREDIETSIKEAGHKLNKELISLVAIFTAMAFLVFGGLNSLSDILELSFKNFSVLNISFVGIIWGLCIFNLIYLFIYLVSKIIDVNVASEDPYYFDKRHRLYITGNVILVAAFAICGWVYVAKTDYLGLYSELATIFGNFTFFLPFVGIICLVILYLVVYKKFIKFLYRKILLMYYEKKYKQKVIIDDRYVMNLNSDILQQR